MKEKIYESYGLKFGISKFARPGTADCIWFTQGQYDYLKDNKATREEFEYLWKMKKADWAFDLDRKSVV